MKIKIIVLSLLVTSVGFCAAPAKGVNPFAAYQAEKAAGTYVPKAKAHATHGKSAPRSKLNTSGHTHRAPAAVKAPAS